MPKSSKKNNLVFRVAIPVPLNRIFDYLAPKNFDPDKVKPGIRLLVPFGKRQKTAVLLEVSNHSELDASLLKAVYKILDDEPMLSETEMDLLNWASRYYHYPLGEVFSAAFPVLLRNGKPAIIQQEKCYRLTEQSRDLNPNVLKRAPKQQALLNMIRTHPHPVSVTQLSKWNKNWRAIINALIIKGYLERVETIEQNNPQISLKPIMSGIKPNINQQAAINTVCEKLDRFSVFLLEGVTGSGKTEVYMQIINRIIEQDGQVLVLLPEITLTPQLESRFQERFSVPIAVSHSNLTDTERRNAWIKMQQGICSILLGTRSALFTPLLRPGLIIIDEEHDSSFKQQEGFRFSARDLAIVRAKKLNVPILLGSATPSLESLYNTEKGRYQLLQLPNRVGNAMLPPLKLLDIRNKNLQEGLSDTLISEIRQTLENNEQVLIFLNRRGFAPTLMCHHCGWVARCRRCDANLVVHYDENILRCHHCVHEQPLLHQCESCNANELVPIGLGTERVEKLLAQLFPTEQIVRLDRDTTQRKGALNNLLKAINNGSANIILGTQMLAKGHHFPNVTLVGIIDVDSGLFSIDFHATEKMAQMVVQVSGRAGRSEKPGKVILQTRQPDHPLLVTLVKQGYRDFAHQALKERNNAGLPPFSHQALFRVLSVNKQTPMAFLERVSSLAQSKSNGRISILGPVPAPMARRAGRYRFQLLLQVNKRQDLHQLLDWLVPEIERLKESRKVRWSLDIDPVNLY